MRKLLPLLLCLLLSGCSVQPQPTTAPEALTATAQAEASLLERYGLPARVFSQRKVQGLAQMGDHLLLFSGHGSTTLTLLNSETFSTIASTTLDLPLLPGTPGLQVFPQGLSYFDPEDNALVLLDTQLLETHRLVLPPDATGIPLWDPESSLLYYPTAQGIHLWERSTGIRRRFKELPQRDLSLSGLHMSGTVLQCTYSTPDGIRTQFLDTADGRLLQEFPGSLTLTTREERYFALLPDALLFGTETSLPKELLPAQPALECTYLPEANLAVTLSDGEKTALHAYDLETGTLRVSLTLDPYHIPKAILSQGDALLLLIYDPDYDCTALLTWPLPAPASGPVYTDIHYTPAAPDLEGLALCQAQAEELSEAYGVSISIWQEAAALEPWDYTFTESYQPRRIREALNTLENCLSQYPAEMLQQTAAHFTSFRICLVDSIHGTAASGSLDTATGIQFLEGSDAYLIIADTPYAQQAFYHEFFHLMETHILSNTNALDRWESLNPSGFSYDYSYAANAGRDSGVYLEPASRAFIDTYSMSYPKEDRARVMEYAMLPGQSAVFSSPILQAKLTALCQSIRDAYGLKKSEAFLLWEQYLP